MKKYFLCIIVLLLLTGCGNSKKITCTFDGMENNSHAKAKIIANIDDDDIISDLYIEYVFDEQNAADSMCTTFKVESDSQVKVNCSGKKVTIEGPVYKSSSSSGTKKDAFIEEAESHEFKCK